MILEWSRATGAWELLADTGELIGRARPIPGDCWEARLEPGFGGLQAWGTDLEVVRDWMMETARKPRP